MSELQSLVDYDWVIPFSGTRLHHVALPPETDDHFDLAGLATLTAACGRTLAGASIPGVFTRMGAMRCTGCCRALGLPPGKGSPKNDDACRPLVGLDPHTPALGEEVSA